MFCRRILSGRDLLTCSPSKDKQGLRDSYGLTLIHELGRSHISGISFDLNELFAVKMDVGTIILY